jgi:hypothetical protein
VQRLGTFSVLVLLTLVFAGCTGGSPTGTSASPTPTIAPTATVTKDTGSIQGLVTDPESLPIRGAEVALIETKDRTLSDAGGRFTFNNLTAGTYKVIANRLGYNSHAKAVPVVAGEITKLSMVLAPLAIVNESFSLMTPYDGMIQCSVSAFSPVNPCGGVTGEDKDSWLFTINRNYTVSEIVVELVWKPTTATTGDKLEIELCNDLQNRDVLCAAAQSDTSGKVWYKYNDGPSPVKLRVNDMPKKESQFLVGAGAAFQGQPVYQQKFAEYVTVCYNGACPDDYSAIPK